MVLQQVDDQLLAAQDSPVGHDGALHAFLDTVSATVPQPLLQAPSGQLR
jgi:hypothetical protein